MEATAQVTEAEVLPICQPTKPATTPSVNGRSDRPKNETMTAREIYASPPLDD